MITYFDPNDVEILAVDVWPFAGTVEEAVIKIRVGQGTLILRVLIDQVGEALFKPVIAIAEVERDEHP